MNDDLRDAEIARLTREKCELMTAGVLSDDARDLGDSVLDYLSHAAAWPVLVRMSLNGDDAATGAELARIVKAVIEADCEVEAIKEVERREAAMPAQERRRMERNQARREISALGINPPLYPKEAA